MFTRNNIMRHNMCGRAMRDWLCFTALEANLIVKLSVGAGTPDPIYLQKSLDGKVWEDYTIGSSIQLSTVGSKVYLRNKLKKTDSSYVAKFSTDNKNFYFFTVSGKVAASGNIMSLIDRSLQEDEVPSYAFYYLFGGLTSLYSAPKLPAKALNSNCYNRMFIRCSSLEEAPKLPAENLSSSCYIYMFYSCSLLNSVKVNFKTWPSSGVLSSWLSGVAELGTFYCPDELPDPPSRSARTVPEGWNIVRPSDGYAQNGLVFQLDCKRGVDTTNKTWTDIKGGKEFSTYKSDFDSPSEKTPAAIPTDAHGGAIIGANYDGNKRYYANLNSLLGYAVANGYHIELCTRVETKSQEGITIQFCCPYLISGLPEEGNIGLYMMFLRDDNELYINQISFDPTNRQAPEYVLPTDIQDGVLTLSHYSLSNDAYYNNHLLTTNGTGVGGQFPDMTNLSSDARAIIYSIRIYNRELSAQERAQNHQLDVERFG